MHFMRDMPTARREVGTRTTCNMNRSLTESWYCDNAPRKGERPDGWNRRGALDFTLIGRGQSHD
jgi:hypothetical protein